MPIICPHCGIELPNGPVGVELAEIYDGILYWVCPGCRLAWPRFASDEASVFYAERHNAVLK